MAMYRFVGEACVIGGSNTQWRGNLFLEGGGEFLLEWETSRASPLCMKR